jgi:hypothetical protein
MSLILKYFGVGKIYPKYLDGSLESAIKFFKEKEEKGNSSVVSFVINSRKLCKKKICNSFF